MTLEPAPTGYPIKLVRDNTAAVVNGSGEPGELWYGPGTPLDHWRYLKLKLAEEVGEYLVDGGLDELSDVLAVIEGLAHVRYGMTLTELQEVFRTDPRGGFKQGVMMYGRHREYDR
jgi:predicted house-cleaning noncanonical NTP pyrophosphatase (MazG superfamily)